MKSLLIFDLDGTLLNTIADMAVCTNYALTKCGFPTHENQMYKYFIGNGINTLFERALPEGEKRQENILRVRKCFLEYYAEHDSDYSEPYDGIKALLNSLQQRGLKIAVASNKYQEGTARLVKHFFAEINFVAVFGQREGVPVKPDPTVVFDILQIANVEKENALYIGDSGVDMQTANRSGVDAVGVTWGFRPKAELEEFAPKYICSTVAELSEYIDLVL